MNTHFPGVEIKITSGLIYTVANVNHLSVIGEKIVVFDLYDFDE